MLHSKKYNSNFRINWKFNKKLVELLLHSAPLGITVFLGSLNTNTPRYFLEYFSGEYVLGIFAGITVLLTSFGTLINSLGQAVTPRLANYYSKYKYKEFYNLIFKLFIFGLLIGLLGIGILLMFGKEILTIVYTSEYAQYINVFLIVMFGAIFLYSTVFLGTGLTAMRKFKIQLPIHTISYIVVLLSSAVLIPKYAIIGAAFVVLLGNLASAIGYIIIFMKYKFNDDKRKA